jgi:hypothetical protein
VPLNWSVGHHILPKGTITRDKKLVFVPFFDGVVPLKMKLKMDDAPVYHG